MIRQALVRASAALVSAQKALAGVAMLLLFGVILANVAARAAGRPLIWADELATGLMAVAGFLAASLAVAEDRHIAVTLLPDSVPALARPLEWIAGLVVLGFFGALCWLCWRWLAPADLLAAGSVEAFQTRTLNFVYSEPTMTLGIRKVWFCLAVPVFALTGFVHVLARLAARYPANEARP